VYAEVMEYNVRQIDDHRTIHRRCELMVMKQKYRGSSVTRTCSNKRDNVVYWKTNGKIKVIIALCCGELEFGGHEKHSIGPD